MGMASVSPRPGHGDSFVTATATEYTADCCALSYKFVSKQRGMLTLSGCTNISTFDKYHDDSLLNKCLNFYT